MYFETNQQESISDLIQGNKLWIKNTANPRMVLLLTVIDRAGRTTSFSIPDTPHPINLSHHVPKDTLETCRDLLGLIQRKALTLVSPADAKSYYDKNPLALQAVARAFSKIENRGPISKDAMSSADQSSKPAEETEKAANQLIALNTHHTDAGGVSAQVKALVMNVRSETIQAEDAVLDLANMECSEADFQYVIDTVDGHLCEAAKKMLAARRA